MCAGTASNTRSRQCKTSVQQSRTNWQILVLMYAGVDVAALLGRIGLTVNATNEKVGTAAIAYAAHKALSPVRFPPTVALTPVVARLLGKDKDGTGGSPPPLNGNGPAP